MKLKKAIKILISSPVIFPIFIILVLFGWAGAALMYTGLALIKLSNLKSPKPLKAILRWITR